MEFGEGGGAVLEAGGVWKLQSRQPNPFMGTAQRPLRLRRGRPWRRAPNAMAVRRQWAGARPQPIGQNRRMVTGHPKTAGPGPWQTRREGRQSWTPLPRAALEGGGGG